MPRAGEAFWTYDIYIPLIAVLHNRNKETLINKEYVSHLSKICCIRLDILPVVQRSERQTVLSLM